MQDRLSALEERYEELGREMSKPDVATDSNSLRQLGTERASLEVPVELYRELKAVDGSIAEANELLADGSEPEMQELARDELGALQDRREQILRDLQRALISEDPNDDKDVILEIRGAAGGDEAALFARDLFRTYIRLAERHRFKYEILSMSETGTNGLKEVVARISGRGAYRTLKFESGVHRVQRVPVTESSGRIHTSTVTVIVLPEVEDVEVDIRDEDLRVDVFRSSGHGGQSVNTTDSAVRITHIPTGIVATSQNERSQIQNRASAMTVLRARVYDLERQKREAEQGQARRSQVQTGDRSEKIRTYNFPQDRVTDHRIGASFHNLPGLLDGELDPLIARLEEAEQAEKLQDLNIQA
jgi:peptide chain release factor 1